MRCEFCGGQMYGDATACLWNLRPLLPYGDEMLSPCWVQTLSTWAPVQHRIIDTEPAANARPA